VKIAVCDDDQHDRDLLCAKLRKAVSERKLMAEIAVFDSGEGLIAALDKNGYGMFFLDIYMKGISGVEAAREIRRRGSDAAIVFTTNSPDHMAEGFDLGALHYLVKPFELEAVEVALDRCVKHTGALEAYIEVTTGNSRRRVLLSDILFAEARDNYCALKTPGEEIPVRVPLFEMEAQLHDERFLRCQRSYIINMDHALRMEGNEFVMSDGTLIPVRRQERSQMKATLEFYRFERARRRL